MKCVEAIRDFSEVDEDGVLQKGKAVLRGSEHRQKDGRTAKRHKRVAHDSSGQRREGIEQAAVMADYQPSGYSREKQREPGREPEAGSWATMKNEREQDTESD